MEAIFEMYSPFASPRYSREINNDSVRISARASTYKVQQTITNNVPEFPASQTVNGPLTSLLMNDEIYHQKMIKGQQRAHTSISNFVMKKEKANWDPLTTKIFCEVCAEEVHAGNRPNTHFSKIGWDNIAWNQLVGTETGLGWDHDKGTVDADDAWWEEKVKVNPKVASFRHSGIENLTEMEIMFSKTFATGNGSFNPYIVNDTEDDEYFENIELVNNLTIKKDQQHEKKRKENVSNGKIGHISRKGKKSKVSTALIMQSQLDRICNVMETTATNTKTNDQSGCSISQCITVLRKIPSIEPKSELFMLGTRLFVKREYREIFIALEEDDIRVNWLEEELKREKNYISRR
ncbi:L10-interacting MYB domain-containing protein-like [Silene latifolia]|uniref:L10-interacting MYB domain-containing protein-like n=1 Tax=Silene latifolia TaxID=37657 RepID=UPI003D770536